MNTEANMLKEAENALAAIDAAAPFLTRAQGAAICLWSARLAARLISQQAAGNGPGIAPAWGNVKQISTHLGIDPSRLFSLLDELHAAGKVRMIGGNVAGRKMQKRYNIADVEKALTPAQAE